MSFFSAAWNRRQRRERRERKGKLGYGSIGRWSYRFGLCGRLGVVDGALVARSLTLLSQVTVWIGMEAGLGERARDVSGAGCGADE